MTDNIPTDIPAAEGGEPDDRTVVRPRRKTTPAPEVSAPVAEPAVAEPVPAPVEPAAVPEPVAPPVEAAPVAAPIVAPVSPAAPAYVAPVAPAAPYAQPNPYAQAAPQPQYRAPGAPKGLSLASMLLGIGGLLLSFFGFGFLIDVAAVITGHLASKRQPHAKGFWLTGIITGYLGIGFSLIYGFLWARYFLYVLGGS